MDDVKLISFNFFGLDVHIHTNSVDFLDIFQINYFRFLSNPPTGLGDPLVFHLMEKTSKATTRPVLVFEERNFYLPEPHMAASRFIGKIFSEMQQRVNSHILIHAGVVSRDGQGIILAADSMHGKSTLVLELVRRGFKFLSDEMAAIHRSDRWVHPFPRSLRVLPESLQRLGLSLPPESREWLGKHTIDIEMLFPGGMGQAVPIRHIIILTDPSVPDQKSTKDSGNEMWFYLESCTQQFLDELSFLDNVSGQTSQEDIYGVKISLRTNTYSKTLGQARALARRHNLVWLGSNALTHQQADFDQPARLTTLSQSQAALQLLNYFQGTHQSVLLGNSSVCPALPLFSDLAELISHASCHQLFVGTLDQMADLVEALPMGESL